MDEFEVRAKSTKMGKLDRAKDFLASLKAKLGIESDDDPREK